MATIIKLKRSNTGSSVPTTSDLADGEVALNTADKNILIFSMFIENKIPRTIPLSVAEKPIVNPVRKKIFFIDLSLKPKVFKIAISLVLFLINIVSPEIILKAATTTIRESIINITFLSTLSALKRVLFKSDQV